MRFRLDHDEREQYYLVLIDKYNIVFWDDEVIAEVIGIPLSQYWAELSQFNSTEKYDLTFFYNYQDAKNAFAYMQDKYAVFFAMTDQ